MDYVIGFLLLSGAFFTLVGSVALIKLDDPMSRLHGPTKSSTLGVGSLLMASVLYSFSYGSGSLHEILVMAFLFVTAPIGANFIAKVHMHKLRGTAELTAPPDEEIWSTYADKPVRPPQHPAD